MSNDSEATEKSVGVIVCALAVGFVIVGLILLLTASNKSYSECTAAGGVLVKSTEGLTCISKASVIIPKKDKK